MSSTYVPTITPKDSETFLPPASCKHGKGDESYTTAQNSDRERMVCAVGLDIHYELTTVSSETGAFQPRLKPFNPRMSGPACPYNYTGKFLDEAEMQKYENDPIVQGQHIEKTKPYDPTLYASRDPRKVSKCVVIRDYGCKVPIDLADTEKVARAVLNHYPDQYIAFLNEFVSNIFGEQMKRHLLTLETGFQKLLDSPEDLNRISWSTYISVQGGIDPRKSRGEGSSKELHNEEKMTADVTLTFSEEIASALAGLTRDGRQMTGQVAASDMFNLRPCLEQHIQTLKDMRSMCQSFGTKEKDVLLMLYYCNEQGRNLAQDLQLMTEYDQPDYNRVRLAVPVNLYHTNENAKKNFDRIQPDLDTTIRSNLQDRMQQYSTTPYRAVSVGHWTGNADSNSVLLRASTASQYCWGWGHAANVATAIESTGGSTLLAPYLQYDVNITLREIRLMDYNPTELAFVESSKFGPTLHSYGEVAEQNSANVVKASMNGHNVSLRDSLMLEPDFHPFRGTSEGVFRSVIQNTPPTKLTQTSGPEVYTNQRKTEPLSQLVDCPTIKGAGSFSTLNPELFDNCEYIDMFFSNGGECFTIENGDVMFPAHVVGPFEHKKFKNTTSWKQIAASGPRAARSKLYESGSEVVQIIDRFRGIIDQSTKPLEVTKPLEIAFPNIIETGGVDSVLLFASGADDGTSDQMTELLKKTLLKSIKADGTKFPFKPMDSIFEVDSSNFVGIYSNSPSSFNSVVKKELAKKNGKVSAKWLEAAELTKKLNENKTDMISEFKKLCTLMGFTVKSVETAEDIKKVATAMTLFIALSLGIQSTHDDAQAYRVLTNPDLIRMVTAVSVVGINHTTDSSVSETVNRALETEFDGVWPIRSVLHPGMKGRNGTLPIITDITNKSFHRANGTFGRSGSYEFDFSKLNNLDKDTSFAFASQSHDEKTQIALQLLLARNIIQYSYGMDVAAVLFHNLVPVAYPHDTTDKSSFHITKASMTDTAMESMIVCSSTGCLRGMYGEMTTMSDDELQIRVLRKARATLLKRIDDTLKKSSNEVTLAQELEPLAKEFLEDLLERIKYSTEKGASFADMVAPTVGTHAKEAINNMKNETTWAKHLSELMAEDADLGYYKQVPTEWIYQAGAPFARDPRMFYAGTYGQYLKQMKLNEHSHNYDILNHLNGMAAKSAEELFRVPRVPQEPPSLQTKYAKFLVEKIRDRKFDNHKPLNALDSLNDVINRYKGASSSETYRASTMGTESLQKIPIWSLNAGGKTVTFPCSNNNDAIKADDLLSEIMKGNVPHTGITFGNTGGIQEKWDEGLYEKRVVVMPIGGNPVTDPTTTGQLYNKLHYNFCPQRPQLFSMLDASAILWNARSFYNPSDSNRPAHFENEVDNMHYWSRTLVESFITSREDFKRENSNNNEVWELHVKKEPGQVFPASKIGSISDSTFNKLFPLLPEDHQLRDDIRRVRALNVIWGTLPTYRSSVGSSHASGAWMPLSVAHQMKLYETVGLFDHKYRVPRNPWCTHHGQGLGSIFNQSYHSVYHTDSYRAPHFKEWCKHACKYQLPSSGDTCYYPFSQYGGTPVEADFIPHRVERPDKGFERRHSQLMYNRFGFTGSVRIGQQYHDTGLLQDLFSFDYKPYRDLSRKQRNRTANAVYPSNFLSYARTHAIVALASCNHGTEQMSIPRVVRNLYRLYVDTYECMGANPDDDGVPVIMGFLPHTVNRKEDRPVVLFAGTLACLNAKLEKFCKSDRNRGEGVCQLYKQVYLNDAALLFTRLLRANRREILHTNNFRRAQLKRGVQYSREQFNGDLINLQDAYIDFLQTTIIGMLIESGSDLNSVPLHLLEPREIEVSLMEEDEDVLGNDYLTPRTKDIIKNMDFGGDNLSRTQLAILSLIPPNNRILGTLRFTPNTEIVDLEHAKKQIQKDTIESNKKVWEKYTEALISGAFSQRLLEVSGQPMDYSFDMSAIRDPLKESAGIASKMVTKNDQVTSTISKTIRGQALRESDGPDSILGMNKEEFARALQAVRDRVERDFERHGRTTPRSKCLAMLKVPEGVKRTLRPEYE